jgi:hypothetical protein
MFQFVRTLLFFLLHRSDITLSRAMSTMIFVVFLQMWCLSLFGQQSQAAPFSRSCAAEEMKSAITDVSHAASRTQILKSINSMAIVSRFNLTVLRTMSSYAAADCPFRQDVHCRMASVIARIRHADQRIKDFEYANGEKIFSSSSPAECTEVENTMERYSESPPPVGTKTDKREPEQLKRSKDFAQQIQVELDSSSDQAPTQGLSQVASRSVYPRLTTLTCSSAGLLTAPSSFAIQSALPWATTAIWHPVPRSAHPYTALDLRGISKVPTQASAASSPPVKLPDSDPIQPAWMQHSAAIVKIAFGSVQQINSTERGLQYSRLRVVAIRPVIQLHPRPGESPAKSGTEPLQVPLLPLILPQSLGCQL